MQVTDTHYGEALWFDIATTNELRSLLKYNKPDLTAITGDAVSGGHWDRKNQTFFQDLWKMSTTPYQEYKTPYAYVSGNHDAEGNLDLETIMKLDKTHDYSISKNLNNDGSYNISSSNYYLEVYSSIDSTKVVAILWFLDTGIVNCEGYSYTWGCVNHEQIRWFKDTSNEIETRLGYLPDGIAFFHIPIREYKDMINYRKIYGVMNEFINCPKKDTYFFDYVLEQGKIRAMFCGHDHDNDFCGKFYGIELCYGRKTGYGSYGPKNMQRGVKVIDLKEKVEVIDGVERIRFDYSHHIVQEDLSEIKYSEQSLRGRFIWLQGRCEGGYKVLE